MLAYTIVLVDGIAYTGVEADEDVEVRHQKLMKRDISLRLTRTALLVPLSRGYLVNGRLNSTLSGPYIYQFYFPDVGQIFRGSAGKFGSLL